MSKSKEWYMKENLWEEIVYEEPHIQPNGARISKSILPKRQVEFNQWAMELGVSSSYVEPLPHNRAMEQLREWR
jgi:hypothetical protein